MRLADDGEHRRQRVNVSCQRPKTSAADGMILSRPEGDTAMCRLQAEDGAEGGGNANAAALIAADGEIDGSRGDKAPAATAGTASTVALCVGIMYGTGN